MTTPAAIDPAAFDIKEVRIILNDDRVYLYVLLGANALDRVGGWWRRVIEPVAALDVLNEMLSAGELDEGWERGYPHGEGKRDCRQPAREKR